MPVAPGNTSPQAVDDSAQEQPRENLSASTGLVKRAVERTVDRFDKLSKSVSGKPSTPSSPGTSPTASGPRRIFSLSRKAKGKQRPDDVPNATYVAGEVTRSPSSTPSASRPTSPKRSSSTVVPKKHADDSPFITPPSPLLVPTRPSLSSFRGDGSMRAGTQTLIQALQAIPWTDDPDNDDDIMEHNLPALDSESDEDSKQAEPMASSIHAIYRPLARSRRGDIGASTRKLHRSSSRISEESNSGPESPSDSEETEEQEDFEQTTPQLVGAPMPRALALAQAGATSSPGPSRIVPIRTGSMATVRLQRRSLLAEKLREVFELDGIEEVLAEMPCWLLRSVLLQGYMYLTNSYLCFFAHMPAREDQILKSGSLTKKAQRTKRWIKHWFVLKNDALSWYQSSSDPYFPHGIADLRYAISCEPVNEKEIKLRTNQKTIMLSADSIPSRDEWVKAIKKVIFKAQNMGDSVKIAIPYAAILDVEKSSAMDFSETIEIKVFDQEGQYSFDSYFFAYFNDLPGALDQIRTAVRTARVYPHGTGSPKAVIDTTAIRPAPAPHVNSFPPSDAQLPQSSSSRFRLTSLLRPFQDSLSLTRATTSPEISDDNEFTHVSRRPNSFVPISGPLQRNSKTSPDLHLPLPEPSISTSSSPAATTPSGEHTYPPSTSSSRTFPNNPELSREPPSTTSSAWSVGVPSWFRTPRKVFSGISNSMPSSALDSAQTMPGVREVYSSSMASSGSRFGVENMAYSILQTPDTVIDPEVQEKFRTAFAYDEKETLLGYFPGYIFRLLPVYGRLYVSTNYFCFKSSGPLAVRTRMALPIRDVLSTETSKATRFGHHGLIVIVKGHEELFFEFGAEDKRDAFMALLDRQIEDCQRRLASGDAPLPTQGERDALILEEFDARPSPSSDPDPRPPPENMTDSLPAVMFTSASSTFLTFKPKESLHFTFLTIGSRGDVQPYIALGKGLMADGHRVRIATHGEFKEWVESYGLEFGYVGGDPAELMRICVENGMFTLSFMKEAMQKFRGWLDDLLKTSWEAAQGTDVLIESPSAMGGYHIAEALGIPYFRAFTMTWSRTRAYPHAFAVPERKMGGSYNYMSYVIFDQVFWRATAGQINRWRRNLLHLGSTSLDRMEPHKIPFLYNFSPHVVPPPLDWPEWIRVTGYWFLDDADVSAKKWTPPPDLVKFIDSAHQQGKKVVYIGFGSIVVSDPKVMTQCVIDAVVQSGVCAVLSKGWSDRLHVKTSDASEPEEPLPSSIYAISSIPHDWLFKRIDAACHHGGAGTTGASLRAGIPTIIKPFFGDQYFWADRVEALGVGSGVQKLTVETLTEALVTATTDVKQISRAKVLGEKIRGENGVATAIEAIYRDLEYSRSLIKKQAANDATDDLEESTIRDQAHSSGIEPPSGYSSSNSARGAPSEDWSVISDTEDHDRRSSDSSRHSECKSDRCHNKRNSLAAAVLSVLPDSLNPGSPRRRSLSINSRS
ncbi:hypothetical protein CCMSSC00406_0000166 [Pleurotus cornucopiae]|uniref:Uncharacterized protein n=1 Tax=Pleurotus cornucopiae TaxID=5321 RepID=A0ACB7IYA1_PLECO|nr:hypothetical protein CCMSSC00406_0000166 [Pleurotus cornucopiae]